MTISLARGERRGAGLLAIVSIGILFATLVLGARISPARAVDDQTACERPLDIVLIIDRSGSMDLVTDGQSRLGWAKDAANQLVTGLQNNGGVGAGGLHQVGLTTYGNRDNSDGIPAGFTRDLQLGGSNEAAVHAAINAYSDSAGNGNTPFRFGMADGADNMLDGDRTEVDGVPVLQVLIFLSDGRPNPDSLDPGSRPSGPDITAYLSSADQAYGIAIGPDGQGEPLSEPDLDLMHDISNPDPENFRNVVLGTDLPDLFSLIQDELLCGDIHITKTPDPAGPVAEGTEVTYTYDVTNSSDETPLTNVEVSDDKCDPVTGPTKSGGDQDELLEFGETWTYECTTPLEETTENTACADGDFIGGGSDSDCATVKVEVIADAPSIKITKSNDAQGTVKPGTEVTYTYEVENTGNTSLNNVEVTDLIFDSDEVACEVDSSDYTESDSDNGILDVGETWTFTCSTTLTKTTENEACVSADVGDQAPQLDLLVVQEQSVKDCDDNEVKVSQSPQQSVEAGTGTPGPTQPNTAVNGLGGAVLPTILFSLLLITSLGTLAYANVRASRRRS